MSDPQILIFGCCVFGIALAATMVLIISPSEDRVTSREGDESPNDLDVNRVA